MIKKLYNDGSYVLLTPAKERLQYCLFPILASIHRLMFCSKSDPINLCKRIRGFRAEALEEKPFDLHLPDIGKPDKTMKNLNIVKLQLPTEKTAVFDTYWRFAAERQKIFFKRANKLKPPWTKDHILQKYKFTNAYRASDRASQFLIRDVIYKGSQKMEEVFFRTLMFKTFNKIETWKMLLGEFDEIAWENYDYHAYDKALVALRKRKMSIYSAAYIMPSGGRAFGHNTKHRNHLKLIQKMMEDDLPSRISDSNHMQDVFKLFRSYPMIGDFLAYQYTIDINYSLLTDFDEMEFVVPGPGARDGLKKCFSDPGGFSDADLIKFMADSQDDEFERLEIDYKNLWGRPLQLIDCQNLFCEVDKYARIAHPDVKGITGRSRIKQKLKINTEPIVFFYPPKWGINESIVFNF